MLFFFHCRIFSSIQKVQRKHKREVLCWARWHETCGLKPLLSCRPTEKKLKLFNSELNKFECCYELDICSSFPNGYLGEFLSSSHYLQPSLISPTSYSVYAWSIFLKVTLVKCEHTIYLLVLRPENKWSLGSTLYTLLEYLGYPFFFTACAITFLTYISCDMHELQTTTNLTRSRNEGDYTVLWCLLITCNW